MFNSLWLLKNVFIGFKQTVKISLRPRFWPETTQQQLFGHVSDFIEMALDGQNISIFVYGQTGAGRYREYWLLSFIISAVLCRSM